MFTYTLLYFLCNSPHLFLGSAEWLRTLVCGFDTLKGKCGFESQRPRNFAAPRAPAGGATFGGPRPERPRSSANPALGLRLSSVNTITVARSQAPVAAVTIDAVESYSAVWLGITLDWKLTARVARRLHTEEVIRSSIGKSKAAERAIPRVCLPTNTSAFQVAIH